MREGEAMLCVETNNTVTCRLQAKLAPVTAEVAARSRIMGEHANPRAMYKTLLEFLYSEIRASVPLLVAAEEKAVELAARGDTVSGALIDWLRRHIIEETEHDMWLLRDYSRIGGDPVVLAAQPGSPSVGAMVGSVYYWTLHAHPVAILGYAAVLESTPPTATFVDCLLRQTGFPPTRSTPCASIPRSMKSTEPSCSPCSTTSRSLPGTKPSSV
jgi:hypothetical protein